MFTVYRTFFRSLFGVTLTLPLLTGGVGVVSLASSPAAVAAQDPGPIQLVVQQCVEQLATSADRTRTLLEGRAQFGAQRISNLDSNDAPVPQIRNAAREAREDLQVIAAEGTQRVNRIAGRCLRFLNENDAPAPAIQIVQQARQAALASIEAKHRNAQRQISQALRAALEDEDLPGGDN